MGSISKCWTSFWSSGLTALGFRIPMWFLTILFILQVFGFPVFFHFYDELFFVAHPTMELPIYKILLIADGISKLFVLIMAIHFVIQFIRKIPDIIWVFTGWRLK